jgi:hypothetical protein
MMGCGLNFVSLSLFRMNSDFPILGGHLHTMKSIYSALHANFAVSVTSMRVRRGAVSHRVAG